MELEGNVALVTGGASGLGEASLRQLVRVGARAVLCDLNDERAGAIVDELGADKVVYVKTDVREEDDVLAALGAAEGLGQLVGVVPCAGPTVVGLVWSGCGLCSSLMVVLRVIESSSEVWMRVPDPVEPGMRTHQDHGTRLCRIRPRAVSRLRACSTSASTQVPPLDIVGDRAARPWSRRTRRLSSDGRATHS